jgi:uncharacterized lipoprotein YmbA
MRPFAPTLAALALLLTGCFGTSPPARFYVLSPSPEGASAVASTGPEGALGVLPTRVAAYLDRPQIVTFVGENSVDLDEFARWAEPIGAGVSRVLAQDLSALLPAWRVLPQPWDPTVPLRARVVVGVTALGWNKLGEARLEANWALLTSGSEVAAARGRVILRRDVSGSGTEAAVAATSALITEMAREIAVAVRALPPAR